MDAKARKPVDWIGTALDDPRAFSPAERNEAGYQLDKVQIGEEPSDWKPMPSVGPGVRELRIRTGRQHRVFYVAKFEEAVYVLHAFQKKSQKTPQADITIGRRRYRLAVEQHSKRQENT